ncbi:MAG: SUMF1/EgtB/PvdO family nonheme iron enzyme, partial [Polyangiaceae bacterium]
LEGEIGRTPLREVPLRRGSYLLRIRARGRAEVRYPVLVERDGHWDGRAPGDERPTPIWLPPAAEVRAGEAYVPAGWCFIGGDPATPDSLPRRRVWVDGFFVGRYPVTVAEYIEFLNDLVARGREAEALAASPKLHSSVVGAGVEPALHRDASGLFGLGPGQPDSELACPVVQVDWHAATAYARWLSARTGRAFRLPNELEREKAARGADGRFLPWGDHVDPTFARVIDTSEDAARRGPVTGHPSDESPYGIRGLSGNTRDWCLNVWRHGGPVMEGDRLTLDPAADEDPEYRVIKGGAWTAMMMNGRAAARFGGRPDLRMQTVGLRVARSALRRA